jgi:transposase
MRKKKYPSDVSRLQFEQIRPLLEGVRRRTKPRTVDLYEVFCAVLYLLKSGCQWRMLPGNFPNGARCILILRSGASPIRTASACWSGL